MILVVYKDFKIEIEKKGAGVHYEIFGPDKVLIAQDDLSVCKVNEAIDECKFTVDEFLETH